MKACSRKPDSGRALRARAQMVILSGNSPRAAFTCIDVSAGSLAAAQRQARQAGLANVAFPQADIFGLPSCRWSMVRRSCVGAAGLARNEGCCLGQPLLEEALFGLGLRELERA